MTEMLNNKRMGKSFVEYTYHEILIEIKYMNYRFFNKKMNSQTKYGW